MRITSSLVFSLVAIAGLASSTTAQVTVRDTIEALPPISFCQDGATHVTRCTRHRLRPPAGVDLTRYEGLPLEITGRPGAVTCAFVDVTAVRVIRVHQMSATSAGGGALTVEFFGDAPQGALFYLVISATLASPPFGVPGITGPVHVDPATWVPIGPFAPVGTSNAYFVLQVPDVPALHNVTFYDQCVALHSGQVAETTNVDCWSWK